MRQTQDWFMLQTPNWCKSYIFVHVANIRLIHVAYIRLIQVANTRLGFVANIRCCTNPGQLNDATILRWRESVCLVKQLEKFTTLSSGVSLYWFYLFTDKSGRDPVLKDAKVLFIVGKIYSPYLITFIAAIPEILSLAIRQIWKASDKHKTISIEFHKHYKSTCGLRWYTRSKSKFTEMLI